MDQIITKYRPDRKVGFIITGSKKIIRKLLSDESFVPIQINQGLTCYNYHHQGLISNIWTGNNLFLSNRHIHVGLVFVVLDEIYDVACLEQWTSVFKNIVDNIFIIGSYFRENEKLSDTITAIENWCQKNHAKFYKHHRDDKGQIIRLIEALTSLTYQNRKEIKNQQIIEAITNQNC